MIECNCCCNIVNNTSIIVCNNCNYKSCKKCCNNFFLTLSCAPKCIKCNIEIDINIFFNFFSIRWVFNKYEKHKLKIIIDKQYNLLDSTIGSAIRKQKEIIIKKKYKKLLNKRKQINQEIYNLKTELKQLNSIYNEGEDVSVGVGEEDYNASYKCKAFSSIIGDIKKCPGCFEYINKHKGCDTVKCIICNTIFNWNSGEIIDTQIYYMSNIKIPELNMDKLSLNNDNIEKIKGIYDNVIDFIRYKMKFFLNILSSYNVSGEDKYKTFRIEFINNKNKSKFIKQIKRVYKLNKYKFYISKLVLNAFNNAINIFNKVINNELLEELENIINITNNNLINITKHLKYTNNIKIYHWFNLNDDGKLL